MEPDWDEVRRLIRTPKPPLVCTVAETDVVGRELRSASVVFDGDEGWWIDDGKRKELRVGTGRTTIYENGVLERFDHGVYSNGWVKSVIQGVLMANLSRAEGEVLGAELVGGRSCWIVEARGLKEGVEALMRLAVDQETGVILRIDSNGHTLEVRDLRTGTTSGEGYPQPA